MVECVCFRIQHGSWPGVRQEDQTEVLVSRASCWVACADRGGLVVLLGCHQDRSLQGGLGGQGCLLSPPSPSRSSGADQRQVCPRASWVPPRMTCLACCSMQEPAPLCHLPFLISPLPSYKRQYAPSHTFYPITAHDPCARELLLPHLTAGETGPGRLTCPSSHTGM